MTVYRRIAEKLVRIYDFDWKDNLKMKEACICSVEMLFANVANVCVVLLVSIALKIPKEVFIYFITFAAMRFYAGGAHAKNYLQCITIYSFVMLCCIYSVKWLIVQMDVYTYIICMISMVIAVYINYKYAGKQKEIGNRGYFFRKRALIILAIIESLIVIMCIIFFQIHNELVRERIQEMILIQACAMFVQSICLFFDRKECIE